MKKEIILKLIKLYCYVFAIYDRNNSNREALEIVVSDLTYVNVSGK